MRFFGKTFAAIGILIILTSFQNCGQPGSVVVQEGNPDSAILDLGAPAESGSATGSPSSSTAGSTIGTAAGPMTGSNGSTGSGMMGSPPMPPKYILKAEAFPAIVKENGSVRIAMTYSNLSSINYSCRDKVNTAARYEGSVPILKQEGVMDVQLSSVASDLTCKFTGENSEVMQNPVVLSELSIEVNCMNRVKNQVGRCEDFHCLKFMELTLNELARVPARTVAGVCYTMKLMSHISNSKSSLTVDKDSEVLSRNHDVISNSPSHPYVLGNFRSEVTLDGQRVVKLSGGPSASQNILVDNFLLLGTYPASTDMTNENVSKYYKVRGTSDSAYSSATGVGIQFKSNLLNVLPFGSGGTSSIATIDISAEIEPGIPHTLDIRALDCGGARELSDIYLLFQ